MALSQIECKLLGELLEERFGLVFDESRQAMIEPKLAPRLAALNLEFQEYYRFLRFHPDREVEYCELASRVTNGETYVYKVRARNVVGEGEASSEVEATPFEPVNVPGQVPSLNAVAKKTRVTVTWTAPVDDGGSPLTGYIIFRGESIETLEEIGQVDLVTSYVDEDVKAGRTYYYTVKAVNAVGPGPWVNAISVKVPKAEVDDDGPSWLWFFGIALVLVAIVIGRFVGPRLKRD